MSNVYTDGRSVVIGSRSASDTRDGDLSTWDYSNDFEYMVPTYLVRIWSGTAAGHNARLIKPDETRGIADKHAADHG